MRGEPVYTPGDSRYAKVRRIPIKGTGSKTVWATTEIRDRTMVRAEVTFSGSGAATDVNKVTMQTGFAADALDAAADVASTSGDTKASGQASGLKPFVKVDVSVATATASWEGYVEYV